MIGQEIVEKKYVAVGKASTFVSLRPKGTIMVDGSTSIAPLMEVINVCTVAQLRTSLLLKSLEGRSDLIAKEIHRLAAYDKEKDTQYCETLYRYLTCCRSLKKTCDALFAHRNTVLYRIRRIRDDLIFHWMILQYMQIYFWEVRCFYLKKRDQIFLLI